jgi:hypothetical protein
MRNACPKCETVYAVTPKDVGRRIVCKKCGSALVIDDDGFRVDPPAPAEPMPVRDERDEPRVRERPRPPRPPREPLMGPMWERVKPYLDPPTVAFAAGVFLVIVALFMPLIGKAKVERRQAAITEERLYTDDLIKQLRAGKSPNEERIKKVEEDWQKRREALDLDVKYAEVGNQMSVYWDRYWLLFGFLCLGFGAIGFMRDSQPLIRRIVGAVVVTAQMLLVFATALTGCGRLPGV